MANGLTEPRPPKGFQGEVWEVDPETGQLRRVDKYIPPLSPNWMRRNFTLGNVLVIISMLVTSVVFTMTWARASELNDVRIAGRVSDIDSRVQRVEAQSMSRETIAAKLDALSTQLDAITHRLDRIEGQRR